MKNIKYFVWDFDGTLFDTYKYITAYLKRALNDFGCDEDERDILKLMMQSFTVAIDHYSEKHSLPELGQSASVFQHA